MNPPTCPRPVDPDADDARFRCDSAAADASTAAWIRAGFGQWLRRAGLDETRLCDIVLAVNEALANVAEYAYRTGSTGSVDLQAALDGGNCTLTVTVADRGHWREPDLLRRQSRRGRGIPLMAALSDALFIDTTALGTVVGMRFDDVHAVRRAAALVE